MTQVFGIGGIEHFSKVFLNVLKVLKPNGYYHMIDMHRPLLVTAKDCFLLGGWYRFSAFETFSYERVAIPLALNQLWGWRDPTICFYILPLITWQDKIGKWWGFETLTFEQESLRWWLGLPAMPVAKIIVKKVAIEQEEAQIRQEILSTCNLI